MQKTTHHVFHHQNRLTNPRCHNRGCWSHDNLTLQQSSSLLFAASPGKTPPQRVKIELLKDDSDTQLQRVPDLLSDDTTIPQVTPTENQQRPRLPPPPWSSYDLASAGGTAITVPTTGAAFTNPSTSDRAANLSTRINELQEELRQSRLYYASSSSS
jgi:hypothetical protein